MATPEPRAGCCITGCAVTAAVASLYALGAGLFFLLALAVPSLREDWDRLVGVGLWPTLARIFGAAGLLSFFLGYRSFRAYDRDGR